MSTEIRALWIKCGDQYYEENEQELSKLELIDEVPENYPPDLIRPTLGCRAICQRSLKLIDRALNDMEEWQEGIRLHATKLLTQMLVHCERTVGPLLIEIIPVLAAKCDDEDRLVTKEAVRAAKIMGILVELKNWKPHALESLVKWRNLGNLKCLTTLFASSSQTDKWNSLDEILSAVIEVEMSYMADPVFQEHLLYFMEMLLSGFVQHGSGTTSTTQSKFYRIFVTILSFCEAGQDVRGTAEEQLEKLTNLNPKIHEDHLPTILKGLDFLEEAAEESVLFLHGLIVYGGIRPFYLPELMEAIKRVLNASDSSEGKVKLLSGISIALRNWPLTMCEASNAEVVNDFIDQCILKSIIWKAGTSNEAIRSMATVALFAVLEADRSSAKIVIPSYVKYIVGLMEDQSVSTRKFSTKIMTLVGPMDVQKLKMTIQGESISLQLYKYFVD